MDNQEHFGETLITLTADIVSAHVSNNSVAVSDLPLLISNVHNALSGLGERKEEPAPKPEPKVSIRSSIKPDYIVCLEDGKKLKMLKRHLMTHYNMTPDEYRQKWGLSADYPMVAPNYAEQRRPNPSRNPRSRCARRSSPITSSASRTGSASRCSSGI